MAKRKQLPFDKRYFDQYCDEGNYFDNYELYSGIEDCLGIIRRGKIKVQSLAVLGTGPGPVLQDFHRALGVKPLGCEISRWAHGQIPSPYRRSIRRMDIVDYVQHLADTNVRVDFIFSNALFYLSKRSLERTLRLCRSVTPLIYFPTKPDGDRWILIDEPYDWWKGKFARHGFKPTQSRYLWRLRDSD